MKRHWQLAFPLALLLVVAALGCASSASNDTRDDSGVQTDAQHDTNIQLDGTLPQDDAGTPQEDGATDGTTQQDGATDGTTQQDGSVTLRTITGTSIAHHVWDTSTADVPDDLSSVTVSALVANATGYDTHAGTGDATGHFTIPNVPAGTYLLLVDGYYYRMSTDTPNLDYWVRGRTGIATTTSTTNLVFNVTNLSAYQQNGDDVIYYASNSDAYDGIAYAGTQPTTGATTLAKTYDLNGTNASNVLATTDDHPILIDLVAAAAGGGSAATAARSLSPTPYAQANGASQNISGAFTNITSTTTTGVNWYRSEFRGGTVIADIGPSAALAAEYLTMSAQPGGNTHGAYASGADLAQLWGATGTTDINFGNVTYGNPFDGTWGQYLFTLVAASFSVTATGATTAATVSGWVRNFEERTSSMSVHMLISPPRALQINGQSATTARTGVTTTPTLSWTAPTTGTAGTYQVYVYQVSNSSGTTTRQAVAAFYTDQTSLKIPTGVLTAGNQYLFRVMAIREPNTNFAVSPWLISFPHGDATAFTALLTP
jgi:hypothetical protein